MKKTLKKIIVNAEKKKIAIGHFNISNLEMLKAIAEVAQELKAPVIIGTSEGEREFIDVHEAVALVKTLREKHGQEIFLNADHTHSLEKAEEAAKAGYDAILFDGAKLPFVENARLTAMAVKLVRGINSDILMEGEIGNIGSGSLVRTELPREAAVKPEDFTKPAEAIRFVAETGVDLLAPAVGNIHGMLVRQSASDGGSLDESRMASAEPPLDIERILAIKQAVKIPLVLHGASGNTDDDLSKAINAGISIVHISTELRIAWKAGMESGLKNKQEAAPYKLMVPAIDAMKKVVYNKLKLFNRL